MHQFKSIMVAHDIQRLKFKRYHDTKSNWNHKASGHIPKTSPIYVITQPDNYQPTKCLQIKNNTMPLQLNSDW